MNQAEKRKYAESTTTDDAVGKRQKVIGPALPSSHDLPSDENSTTEDESSDEDDIGPGLPPAGGVPGPEKSTGEEIITPPNGPSMPDEHYEDSKVSRDDWMLRPPEAMDWASRVDPTKLKNRKFQTGRSAGASADRKTDSSWTETPEQKMKRLQDQMMGVSSQPSTGARKHEPAASSEAMQHKLRQYRKPKSTEDGAEVHRSQQRRHHHNKEEDDDPSSRAFDKEKDMSLSSKLNNSQRREVINKAADFSSRFTSGKFL